MTTSAEARILTSAAFRRARLKASSAVTEKSVLRRLLADVDTLRRTHPRLDAGMIGLDLDIVCSVVDAHVDAAALDGIPASQSSEPSQPTSITARARLGLVVAALFYLVDADDVVPDSRPLGFSDDIALLHWASRMARAELPAA